MGVFCRIVAERGANVKGRKKPLPAFSGKGLFLISRNRLNGIPESR